MFISAQRERTGQTGHQGHQNNIDQKYQALSLESVNKGAGSSARIEHHPPKVGVVGSNPTLPVWDKAITQKKFLIKEVQIKFYPKLQINDLFSSFRLYVK